MNLIRPLSRGLALTGALVVPMLAATPAAAAPADVALLQSYIGSWKGTGELIGSDEAETVRCKLDLTQGDNDKVHYDGDCYIAGSPLSVRGTLAYVDEARRFEAAMTSNAGFSPENAIGRRVGDGVRFNLRERATDEDGNDVTITAAIALRGGSIKVELDVLFNESGDHLKASVPFTK